MPVGPFFRRHPAVDLVRDQVFDPDQAGVGSEAVVEDALADVVIDGLAEVVGDARLRGPILPQMHAGEGERAVKGLGERGLDVPAKAGVRLVLKGPRPGSTERYGFRTRDLALGRGIR